MDPKFLNMDWLKQAHSNTSDSSFTARLVHSFENVSLKLSYDGRTLSISLPGHLLR